MAINFNNVTDILLGNQQVTQIEDSLGNVLWSATPADEYFYVEDISGAANTLSIVKNNADAPTIEVFKSTNMSTWESMGNTDTTAITATVPANGKLYLKAVCNRWGNDTKYNTISASGNHNVGGNSMSLLYGDNYQNQTTFPNNSAYVFPLLFYRNTKLKNAVDLKLPATTLVGTCYYKMFRECSGLLTAPAILPALTLTTSCYRDMFNRCSSLTTPPVISATTMNSNSCQTMFWGCASLVTPPALPATTLAQQCYVDMFSSCTSLTTAPELPATTLAPNCYQYMFYGDTALTTAPVLPAQTLVSNCYNAMFNGCTSLASVITYADNISAGGCLDNWLNNVAGAGDFYNLGSATYIADSASGIPSGWVERTSIPDYFYVEDLTGDDNTTLSIVKREDSAPTIEVFYSTDKTNWTSMGQTSTTPITATIPADGKLYLKCTANSWSTDPASSSENIMSASGNHNVGGSVMSLLRGDNYVGATLTNNERLSDLFLWDDFLISAGDLYLPPNTVDDCFRGMFFGCSGLTTPPVLPAKRMYWQCYRCMFYNCTSLTTAPALPAETLADGCYHELFSGCTSLTSAPALPATTLAEQCYQNMFLGCSSLTTAPALPATTLAASCYQTMFQGCTALTTAPATLPATTLEGMCYYQMFDYCIALTTSPVISATALVGGYCCEQMFSSCSSLNTVTTYFNDLSADGIWHWLSGVAATGDFYNLGGATYVSGEDGIPTGWTEHTSL